jgi:4-hydroxybenzoate polyprenyltransferase
MCISRWNVAFLTIVPLTGLYPFMKRITYFPQVWLGMNSPDNLFLLLPVILKGMTLNAPVLIASAVFINKISWAAMILAAGGLAYVNISCF